MREWCVEGNDSAVIGKPTCNIQYLAEMNTAAVAIAYTSWSFHPTPQVPRTARKDHRPSDSPYVTFASPWLSNLRKSVPVSSIALSVHGIGSPNTSTLEYHLLGVEMTI
ncbi:hypothetical protein SCP_1004950 [Sparassis crispa]|uniref:Uncharacterized protein n=1 Tax=Sparassis crispa TaxID=139825 RepID=A0A401GYK8_9APHY|nr:hypothetical protein SCP_1004950 [Sparassis crispa]GBE87248.1 hypothetical protein SCP_1004950 [Sparassis crispa]